MTTRAATIAMAVVATLGAAVAGYLTYVHYAGITPVCAIAHGCEKVQSSKWSEVAGVPVAVIGLAGYLAILASLLVPGEKGRLAGLALAVTGCGFSAWLTYVEVFEIHAICQWCVTSAILMTLLTVLATLRFLRAELEDRGGGASAGRRR